MEIVKIRSITPNPDNPRLIKNEKYKLLLHSVKVSPAFMLMNPIKVDLDNMILGGNMRYKACMELKKKEVPIEVFTREHAEINNKARREEGIKEATYEEQCREYVIKDNISFGEHDWDVLGNEWDEVELKEWGLDVWQPEEDYNNNENDSDTDYLENYLNKETGVLKLSFLQEQYKEVIERLDFIQTKEGAKDHSETFLKILENYERV
tara:strand:+ start:573 stop:1196 length:624 start_codon:yes stop_codon:yes gene_type:complete